MSWRDCFFGIVVVTCLAANIGCKSGEGDMGTYYAPQPPPALETVEVTPRPTVVITSQTAPPPPRVVVRPARPGLGYAWRSGHWTRRHDRYVWVPGYWTRPPKAGNVWVQGHYRRTPRGYVYVPGHWR